MPTRLAKKKAPPRKLKAKTAARAMHWKLRRRSGLQMLESPSLGRLDWLTHGFSTRPGGASELITNRDGANVRKQSPTEKVLNLGFTDWDSRDRVLQNRGKFFAALGASKMRIVACDQSPNRGPWERIRCKANER